MDSDMSGLTKGSSDSTLRPLDPIATSDPAMSSDEELELALPEVSEESTPEEPDPVISSLPIPQSFPNSNPFFMRPPNPSIPQDLAVIAELVNTFQAVGSLPPMTISAAEKRRQVEASIRAKMEALKSGKGKGKEVDSGGLPEGPEGGLTQTVEVAQGEEGASGSLEADAALRSELDRFIGKAPANANDDSSSDSDSSSEFLSDSDAEDEDDEEAAEFIFSNSPAPSPRKRPMKFEYIEDDEEPISADPIMSANEAPLPPVPQPPFATLPKEETLSLAGEVVSWMRDRQVEAWWGTKTNSGAVTEGIRKSVDGLGSGLPEGVSDAIANGEKAVSGDSMMEEGEVEETTGGPSTAIVLEDASAAKSEEAIPRFASSGTVVIRAMQQRPGQEGWLEEGSVVCHHDGRVLGFVSDTFGPLTSPFYSVRLPPPPFPLPTLPIGTRLSYPINPQYRSFVNMLAVRDPRFKGSDASNIHDEEVGEEEAEWSDDEMEAEAKKRKKNKRSESKAGNERGGWAAGASGPGGGVNHSHSLPVRPHFDYVPDDASDAVSFYGGAGEDMDDGMVSEAGSSASRRPVPMPYELDEPGETGPIPAHFGDERQSGEGKSGKGQQQGRSRGGGRDAGGGRGRGADRGGRGGGRGGAARGGGREERGGGRGAGRGVGAADRGSRGRGGNRGGGTGSSTRPNFGLPQKPQFDPMSIPAETHDVISSFGLPPPPASLPNPPSSAVTGHGPSTSLSHPYAARQPVLVDQYRPQQIQQQRSAPQQAYPPQQPQYQPQQYHVQQHQQPFLSPGQQQQQHPHQNKHAPAFPYSSHQYNPQPYNPQHAPQAPQGPGGVPAINPRFAAQYQQMQLMSQMASWQSGGQGGAGGERGGGGPGPYGYTE